LLLIHGSAADHTTWSIQLASSALRARFELIAYDRRSEATTVEAHADDAAALLAESTAPAMIAGSSFGAVVALDLIRRYPAVAAGAVLIEPPLAPTDDAPPGPAEFLPAYDRVAAEQGGEAAAEMFLRAVLGDAALATMPRRTRERSLSKWREIRSDSAALIAYRPRYTELATVRTPVRLLGGGRSAVHFGPTLTALATALPSARLELVEGAGHMLQAEAHRRFAEILTRFAAELCLA
jgi:pimeloyl-ACP methyl ester carboxylesterase